MQYTSTRGGGAPCSAAAAILQGLAEDGGLLTPETLPTLTECDFTALRDMDYPARAAFVMKLFLTDYTSEELETFAREAYAGFDTEKVTPLRDMGDGVHCLELWHGPTCAFKDLALQMLPKLLAAALKKEGRTQSACILTATSGDTGKAALEGFCDAPQTKILVFYPRDGVSDMQKLQMQTQQGKNLAVCGVAGNFDDAQTGVKALFATAELRKTLADEGYFFSSANSMNWGRILPQLVYYVSAYCDLVENGTLKWGETLDICVPTGNFGNILSAYYAKQMGLPLGTLLCASNENDVLTEFIQTGCYNRKRPFFETTSPSMDILVSSNLERLLFALSGRNAQEVRGYMESLQSTGSYTVLAELFGALAEQKFAAGSATDEQAAAAICALWRAQKYLLDPHTAVALHVLQQHRAQTKTAHPTMLVATASPFKFSASVLEALGACAKKGGAEQLEQLEKMTGISAPKPLIECLSKGIRFTRTVEQAEMLAEVLALIRA